VSGSTYRLRFAPQTLDGSYEVRVGPFIEDESGAPMNQNGNLIDGEPDDFFSGSFTIDNTGPVLLAHTPSQFADGPFSQVEVEFNELIATGTFTTADVLITGPLGNVVPTSVVALSGTRFRVTFPAQQQIGNYEFRIGPNITDVHGNLLNSDGD